MPVEETTLTATLPGLQPPVGDMVQIQRLTGMRPDEVCMMTPAHIDRSEGVWRFVPPCHKMTRRKKRTTCGM